MLKLLIIIKVINIFCYHWNFNYGFKFQNSVCNCCHDLTLLCLNINNVAIITVKSVDYCFIIHGISKSEAIHLLKKSIIDDPGCQRKCMSKKSMLKIVHNYYFKNLIKAKTLETENILINNKNNIDLGIYFTRYVHSELMKALNLNYHELIRKVRVQEGKNI